VTAVRLDCSVNPGVGAHDGSEPMDRPPHRGGSCRHQCRARRPIACARPQSDPSVNVQQRGTTARGGEPPVEPHALLLVLVQRVCVGQINVAWRCRLPRVQAVVREGERQRRACDHASPHEV